MLRDYLNKIKPNFKEGGKLAIFRSVFDGSEALLFVPNGTSKMGVHIRDYIDSKRATTMAIIALLPALLFSVCNVGYQHDLAVGADPGFLMASIFGFLVISPKIIVSHVISLGIEFTVAQMKREEIQEGLLASGILIPMVIPVDTPSWMIAVATAFAAISAEEVFGGTGHNIFSVTLVTRVPLFFVYPTAMFDDQVFVRITDMFGIGAGQVVDGFSGTTPLGQVVTIGRKTIGSFRTVNVLDNPVLTQGAFVGLVPDSIGETSVSVILIDAVILLVTGVVSRETMVSTPVGDAFMSLIFDIVGTTAAMCVSPLDYLFLGGFAFGAVFVATNPVTSTRTETDRYIYSFLVGAMVVIIHALNLGYPEGMMLTILSMDVFAPLIDYYVMEANISRRLKRVAKWSKKGYG